MRRAGRRPANPPTAEQTDALLRQHREHPAGVLSTAKRMRNGGHVISYGTVYRIMRDSGLVTQSPAKSGRRKWVRYERRYSNALWHTDWHVMKDPRFRGLCLVTFLDDSSRCVTGARLFTEATSENAVTALAEAIGRFGTPAAVLSDNGRCFNGGRSKRSLPRGSWNPTAFEAALLDREIEMINSRPYHPQTNGKLERFHGSIEAEIHRHESLSAYVAYYNEERLHWSLDIDHCETPLQAFGKRRATEAIRKSDPKWMERDTND